MTPELPAAFSQHAAQVLERTLRIPGGLTAREIRFLTLLAAAPTAEGHVLEIGSYKGRSTVVIASTLVRFGLGTLVAVDPLCSPSKTDPDLKGKASIADEFHANLKSHGMTEAVEFHQAFSQDLARTWNRPLRLLWHDGDHTYFGAKRDFDLYVPHLVTGGIIAMHDVLHEFEGNLRVFMEDILLSDRFAACGICGSIGWAQLTDDPKTAMAWRPTKLRLYRALSRMVPLVALDGKVRGSAKLRWKLYHHLVPHAEPSPEHWVTLVQRMGSAPIPAAVPGSSA